MTILEALMFDIVVIDFDYGIDFGYDQAYVSYPTVFPTVTFRLEETVALMIVSKKLGLGGHEFFISLNGYNKYHVDTCITVSDGRIDLTEEEQKAIFSCLNEQCVEELGKTCDDLLAEARERML